LTTVRQPMEAMGTTAVGIVMEGINAVVEGQEFSAVHRKLTPELVARESTRPWADAAGRKSHDLFSA
jgi:DNA-binding LacI/PurR family transcriptional regulator